MILHRIDPLSAAKVLGVLYALLGFLVGGLFSVFAVLGATLASEHAVPSALIGVGAIVVFPILYGALGAISGLLVSFLYNLVAGFTGGIELDLRPKSGV